MLFVIWKKNGMKLRVLDTFRGKWGELRFMVCKASCPNPIMGRFSVEVSETSAENLSLA